MIQGLPNHYVEHRYGGNHFIIIRDLPQEMCLVYTHRVREGSATSEERAFVAWRKLLSVEQLKGCQREIPTKTQARVSLLRSGLESGDIEVKNSRFVFKE